MSANGRLADRTSYTVVYVWRFPHHMHSHDFGTSAAEAWNLAHESVTKRHHIAHEMSGI